MHEPSIVAVLFRWRVPIALEATIFFTGNTIAPIFHREGRICHYVIETFKYGIIGFIKILRI